MVFLACDKEDEESEVESTPSSTNQVDDDGFATGGLELNVAMLATGGEADATTLRMAEPTGSNSKYYHTKSIIAGAPTQLIIYPDTGHGLSKMSHRKAKIEWDKAWLDHWVPVTFAD